MRNFSVEGRVLVILAVVQVMSVLFSLRVDTATMGTGEGDAGASVFLFALILMATALMLILVRLGLSSYLYTFSLYGGIFTVIWFLSLLILGDERGAFVIGGVAMCAAKMIKGRFRMVVSTIISIGISVMMGIFFGPIALIGLMLLLSFYDYIAVRKTHHMETLAEDVIKNQGPQMIQVGPQGSGIVIGIADIIFPSALCVSAYAYASPGTAFLCAACSHAGIGFMLTRMGQDGMPAIPYGSLGIIGYIVGAAIGI